MLLKKILFVGLLGVYAFAVLVAGSGCDMETILNSGGDPLALLGPESGLLGGGDQPGFGGDETVRSFTTVDENGRTNSFSLTPGIDPGESLETFLSGSIVY